MIEKIIRICDISEGLQMVAIREKEKASWIMVISPNASDKIRKSGIKQAKKLKIPYETWIYKK